MIVSYTGIGRNAALICFREAVRRLPEVRDPAQIDALLEDIVLQGRRARGPCFLHSAEQLAELKHAVVSEFQRCNPQSEHPAAPHLLMA